MTDALQVLQPSSVIECAHYACKLSARACVLRQRKQIHSLYGKPMQESTQRLTSFCLTGQCEQGKAIAAQLAGVAIAPARIASVFLSRPKLELVKPPPRARERRRIAPLSTLPPAALEDIGEDLDAACAPARPTPPPPEILEQRQIEVAAAVLARREEQAAVRPPPQTSTASARSAAGVLQLHRLVRCEARGARNRGGADALMSG